MPSHVVARRFARALFGLAGDDAAAFADQLQTLVAYFASTTDTLEGLSLPTLSGRQRQLLMESFLASCTDLSPLIANLLRVLSLRGRLETLPLLSEEFLSLVDAGAGRRRGTLTSAVALGPDQVQAITAQLERLTQHRLVLETRIDPALLGGVVAMVGTLRFDGSIRSQLEALASRMREG